MGSDKRQKFEPGCRVDYHLGSKNTIGIVERFRKLALVIADHLSSPERNVSLFKEDHYLKNNAIQ